MVKFGESFRPKGTEVLDRPPSEDRAEAILGAVLEALVDLKLAIKNQPPPIVRVDAPPPVVVPEQRPTVVIQEPDLSDIVTAVSGLRTGATSDEVAEAIVNRLNPTAIPAFTEPNDRLIKILETLDYRIQGFVTQAYGGGAASMTFGGKDVSAANPLPVTATISSITGEVEIKNDVGNPVPISAANLDVALSTVSTQATQLLVKSDLDEIALDTDNLVGLGSRFYRLLNQAVADGNEIRTSLNLATYVDGATTITGVDATSKYFATAADGSSFTGAGGTNSWTVLRIQESAGSAFRWRTVAGARFDLAIQGSGTVWT